MSKWKQTGAGVSRHIEDPLVAFGCCLLYGRVVVALTHSPFPFSILLTIYLVSVQLLLNRSTNVFHILKGSY